ncbi:MAG: AraC family transcriptional regulator [Crocinitomicaceae bacterium]|nr:AraC family transcriptional regulator [Crocinitomicaceae bacterium]
MDEIYLTSSDYKRVKYLVEIIDKNPGFEYSVEYLCRESTLSPFKLQEGFKRMFRSTAMDYVRDIRLEKALFLIKTTDLSISEIVYSIGLTSRSYFSKIFKLKYKCSPRIFRKQSQKTISFN